MTTGDNSKQVREEPKGKEQAPREHQRGAPGKDRADVEDETASLQPYSREWMAAKYGADFTSVLIAMAKGYAESQGIVVGEQERSDKGTGTTGNSQDSQGNTEVPLSFVSKPSAKSMNDSEKPEP